MSLSADARHALSAVLDTIVPPSADGRLPGAGALGLAAAVEADLREHPELRPVVLEGLAALDGWARARDACPFADLDAATRREALDAVAAQHPAFLAPLILLTYMGYYREPRVLAALGLEARPPYPGGYPVPATDFSLLDPVREKAPFYRRP